MSIKRKYLRLRDSGVPIPHFMDKNLKLFASLNVEYFIRIRLALHFVSLVTKGSSTDC